MSTVLPPQAHTLAAQLEDTLEIWRARDRAHRHPRVREAGVRACRLCDDMIVVFHLLREQIATELGEYDAQPRM